jgi:porphobilinogen synthase
MNYLNRRPRRNRQSQAVRNLAEETVLLPQNLVFPLFLLPGENKKEPISSMPGISRLTLDHLLIEVEQCMTLGVQAFDIFPCVPDELKNQTATYSYAEDNFYLDALSKIKHYFPESWLMTDVAMDPYSSDGHDGLVENKQIVNDKTLEILAKMSVAQAQAGADVLGPSDMMDGRVGYLREALDKHGFTQVGIVSYTAKYASGFYGPFRDALNSAPRFGDKKTYQMNPANVKEAILEAQLDFEEGADMMMVKPALCYLDVIKALSEKFPIPIAAYQVSGEFSMLHAAAQNGWLDLERVMVESLLSIRRAGAQVILSYFAKDFARWYKTTRS